LVNSYYLQIINNLITKNKALKGGGIYIKESFPVFINNTFRENRAEESGGAFYIDDMGSGAVILNTIMWNDSASAQPNEIFTPNADLLEIAYSNIENGWEGINNMDEDPFFIDDSCHLHNCLSPCINVGIDEIEINGVLYYCPINDFEGDERPYLNTLPDIGADETPCLDTFLDYYEDIVATNILNVFPNPLYDKAIIDISIKVPGYSILSIVDVTGNVIETLVSENLKTGNHSFQCNAKELPEGIYFWILKTNEGIQTKKIIKM
jgi:predicted outer membrane repeat protein